MTDKSSERADSLLYQFTSGVIKMRMAGAEERAALEYLRPLHEQAGADAGNYHLRCFFESLPVFGIVLTAQALLLLPSGSGESFGNSLAWAISLSLGAAAAFSAVKTFSRICSRQRFIQMLKSEIGSYSEEPSSPGVSISPDGDISLNHVSFAYEPDGAAVLNDFSLHIRRWNILRSQENPAAANPHYSGCCWALKLPGKVKFSTPAIALQTRTPRLPRVRTAGSSRPPQTLRPPSRYRTGCSRATRRDWSAGRRRLPSRSGCFRTAVPAR